MRSIGKTTTLAWAQFWQRKSVGTLGADSDHAPGIRCLITTLSRGSGRMETGVRSQDPLRALICRETGQKRLFDV